MTIPAAAGPRNRAALKMIALIASAEGSDARSTRVGIRARREGWATALKTPRSKVSANNNSIVIASVDQNDEQARLDAAGDLRDPNDPNPVAPVGQRSRERAQKHDRKKLCHRDDAEPGAGMGQCPGEPTDRHALHPDAVQRDGVAAAINAVIPVSKRAEDTGEPVGEQAITDESQEIYNLE